MLTIESNSFTLLTFLTSNASIHETAYESGNVSKKCT